MEGAVIGRKSAEPGRGAIGVALAVAILLALSAGASMAHAAAHDIDILESAFQPATLSVIAGEPVTWTNASGVTHTVTSDEGTELDSGPIGPGEAYGHVFETPGTYAYHCSIHSSMKGTITVLAAPATATPSGSPEPTPPAGTLPPNFSPFPSTGPVATPVATAAPTPSRTSAPVPSVAPAPSDGGIGGALRTLIPVVILGGLGFAALMAVGRRGRPPAG
jgi:plastocyanin